MESAPAGGTNEAGGGESIGHKVIPAERADESFPVESPGIDAIKVGVVVQHRDVAAERAREKNDAFVEWRGRSVSKLTSTLTGFAASSRCGWSNGGNSCLLIANSTRFKEAVLLGGVAAEERRQLQLTDCVRFPSSRDSSLAGTRVKQKQACQKLSHVCQSGEGCDSKSKCLTRAWWERYVSPNGLPAVLFLCDVWLCGSMALVFFDVPDSR